MKEYFEILYAFLRIGLFTFGGGYAMIPIVERELIVKRKWISMEEVMDYYTISQITPGLIGVNLSTFAGNKQKGILGGILATFGFVFPGATAIILVALLIGSFAGLPAVQHAFAGIRIAVAALILDTVITMVRTVFKGSRKANFKSLIIYIVVFVISVFPYGIEFIKSPVTLVLLSGLAGLIVFRQTVKTGKQQ